MKKGEKNWNCVPTLSRKKLNDNEQRVLGGFLVESPYNPDDFELIQVEVPVGIQRVAKVFHKNIETDLTLSEVLEPTRITQTPKGFLTEKDISDRWGAGMVPHTANVDAIAIMKKFVYVIEIKTKQQKIKGIHEVYEGLGQVIMNKDRFIEDYPSISREKEIRGLLLAESSDVEIELIKETFINQYIGYFDPTRGGFLINPGWPL